MALVSTATELGAALREGGEIILAPGEYGSVLIRGGGPVALISAEPLGAVVDTVHAVGVAGELRLEGLAVRGRPSALAMLQVETNRSFPGLADVIVTGCDIRSIGEPRRTGAVIRRARTARVSDSTFSRVKFGVSASAVEETVLERVTLTDWQVDGFRSMRALAGEVATGAVRFAVRDCLLAYPDATYVGPDHRDCIQIGATADAYPHHVQMTDNVLWAPTGAVEPPVFFQGFHIDDNPHGIDGEVARNVIVCGAQNGISTWASAGLAVQGNVIVGDWSGPGRHRNAGWIAMRAPAGAQPAVTFRDNVASQSLMLDGVGHPGFRRIAPSAPEGSPEHYATVLHGAWAQGPHGPVPGAPDLALVGPEAFKAWARAALAAR